MAKCKNHAKREWPTNRQCGELNGVQLLSFELLLRKVLFVLSVYSISYRNVQGEVESPGQSNVYSIKSFESNIEGSLSRKSKAPGVYSLTPGALKRRFHTKEKTSPRAVREAPETKQTKSWPVATGAGFKGLG
jgi:hypothetical protein